MIGDRIKKRRKEVKLSLRELGERTGLTAGFISHVENEKVSPSLASLQRIATALDVPMFYFMDGEERPNPVVRVSERRTLFFPKSHLSYDLLTPALNGKMMSMMIRMEPGARRIAAKLARPTEQWMYVLEGCLEIKIGEDEYRLTKGDSIYYDGDELSEFAATGSEPLELIVCITPPAL